MSFGIPFRTTLRVRSSGRLKLWNSILWSIMVVWISRKVFGSEVCMDTCPFAEHLADKEDGLKSGSL
jgi:hypothetical protein